MKKVYGYFSVLFIIAVLMSVNSVFAETVAEVAFGKFSEFIDILFQENSPFASLNFTRILLGLLLWMVMYSVVKNMELFDNLTQSNIWTSAIALIITILSFIYLPENFENGLAAPYSAVGATILTVIPFLIIVYFTFMVTDSLIVAKTIWMVFIFYYFSILISTISGIESSSIVITSTSSTGAFFQYLIFNKYALPYWVMIFVGVIIFYFLRNIRYYVNKQKALSLEERIDKNTREFGASFRGVRKVGRELVKKKS